MSAFSENLLVILEENKLSRKSFAEALGVNPASVTRWISGENNPSSQTIKQICGMYGYNPEWLAYGRGDPKAPPEPELPAREDIASLLGHAITHNTTAKDAFIRAVSQADEETIAATLKFMQSIAAALLASEAAPADTESAPETAPDSDPE